MNLILHIDMPAVNTRLFVAAFLKEIKRDFRELRIRQNVLLLLNPFRNSRRSFSSSGSSKSAGRQVTGFLHRR